jgi:tetratricopeptide (TPR) repeat protein
MKSLRDILFCVLATLGLVASVHAQSPREQLKSMVEQLQTKPGDNALREKIIKVSQEVKPAPAVPPEARRAFVMGGTYQKEAKSAEDFALAIKAFEEAAAAAPWWGDAYYNLSVALESAKRYDEAKDALTLYLLTRPKDAEQAQERLYAIDAKKTMAARAVAASAAAAIAFEERRKNSTEGYWFDDDERLGTRPIFRIERVGETLVVKSMHSFFTLSGAQLTETSISATNTPDPASGMAPVRYNLELRGGDLVGTAGGRPYRMIRKPWSGN